MRVQSRYLNRVFSFAGLLFYFAISIVQAQPVSTAIRVVSPSDGSSFEPGTMVEVVVEPEGPAPLQEVVVVTPGVARRLTTAPFQFSFPAAQDLGPKKLAVIAQDQKNKEFLKEITYHVETTTGVTSILVAPSKISFFSSRQDSFSVTGTFADGQTRVITKSRDIRYVSSDAQVATVTGDGHVQAVGEGAATITVTYKGKSVTVPVKVEFQRQSIQIDIMPGSSVNRINLDSQGNIPVAILTTQFFDPTRVDPLSVRFGPNGATEVHGRGHFEDVDGDGFSDMVLHFDVQETGVQCLQTTAVLTGSTLDGVLIRGVGPITPRGNNCIESPYR